jgi:hypothetical protein
MPQLLLLQGGVGSLWGNSERSAQICAVRIIVTVSSDSPLGRERRSAAANCFSKGRHDVTRGVTDKEAAALAQLIHIPPSSPHGPCSRRPLMPFCFPRLGSAHTQQNSYKPPFRADPREMPHARHAPTRTSFSASSACISSRFCCIF